MRWGPWFIFLIQRAKKVVSGSPGQVDLAVGLVNSVINLPDGQVNFLGGNSNYRRTVINPAHQIFGGLVEMTFGLVHASYSLPEWQAVKLTFFAHCYPSRLESHTILQIIMSLPRHYFLLSYLKTLSECWLWFGV